MVLVKVGLDIRIFTIYNGEGNDLYEKKPKKINSQKRLKKPGIGIPIGLDRF